ncbi:zinc ribbon domain-containing protein [Armatimonas rosea]|uniref:Ribosomal protein L37AE/L43A n=1 Tax=Armatimonas rosea TaxID=685828 RepID=A0A7W9ST11_ARMRO|nr:zinc ribbon domain-containing protein [Armatimonas rosea]MBB6052327.1 ribosomal protein L37AE/L43A [Armatimonas rosea]
MVDENTGSSRLILTEEEPETKVVRIPLPPQLKADEEQQREAERAADAVAQAALLQHARRGAQLPPPAVSAPPVVKTVEAKPKQAAAPEKCPSCGQTISAQDAGFSFCTHCGADLPKASLSLESAPRVELRPPVRMQTPQEEVLPNGVRDTRATVRKIVQVHNGVGQLQAQQVASGTTSSTTSSAQVEIEFRREVNPTVHAILSFLFPGVGQLLNGQVGKGILLILAAFVAVTLLRLEPFGILMLILRAGIGMDAYKIGEKRRNGQKVGEGDWEIA